jgi:hypothetical protein
MLGKAARSHRVYGRAARYNLHATGGAIDGLDCTDGVGPVHVSPLSGATSPRRGSETVYRRARLLP